MQPARVPISACKLGSIPKVTFGSTPLLANHWIYADLDTVDTKGHLLYTV